MVNWALFSTGTKNGSLHWSQYNPEEKGCWCYWAWFIIPVKHYKRIQWQDIHISALNITKTKRHVVSFVYVGHKQVNIMLKSEDVSPFCCSCRQTYGHAVYTCQYKGLPVPLDTFNIYCCTFVRQFFSSFHSDTKSNDFIS